MGISVFCPMALSLGVSGDWKKCPKLSAPSIWLHSCNIYGLPGRDGTGKLSRTISPTRCNASVPRIADLLMPVSPSHTGVCAAIPGSCGTGADEYHHWRGRLVVGAYSVFCDTLTADAP